MHSMQSNDIHIPLLRYIAKYRYVSIYGGFCTSRRSQLVGACRWLVFSHICLQRVVIGTVEKSSTYNRR